MKVVDLLKDESCWIKGVFARDKNGVNISLESPHACKFCIHGAIRRAYGTETLNVYNTLETARKTLYPQFAGLLSFNDAPETTFEDVKKVLELANV